MAHEELRERSLAVWSTGDYAPTSGQLAPASDALVETLGITAAHDVLDVAAGHGNAALAAARRGARVVATDFSPVMVEVGRQRTAAQGHDITWQLADAARLPLPDGAFDRVTSVFGAIFAVDQAEVAVEVVRVLRPGGQVGLTAWTPDGLTARTLAVARRFGPSRPADAPDPFRWGDPDHVAALFAPSGCTLTTRRRTLTMRYASWQEWREVSEAHGAAVVARQHMAADDYAAMSAEMEALTAEVARREGDGVALDLDYLEIVGTRV